MSGQPLYQRDPAAWQAHLAEGNATQPRKRVSADALIRDPQGRILLVDPGYKPGWDLPGGMAEANESPAACIQRELREELGLALRPGRVLVIDWVPPHSVWDDMIAFIFHAGTLTPAEIHSIRLDDGELDGFAFFDDDEAAARLRPRAQQRMTAAAAAAQVGATVYLQDGQPWAPAVAKV